jgi:peptidoglycan/LPS O-acetylase OafA/YrhL
VTSVLSRPRPEPVASGPVDLPASGRPPRRLGRRPALEGLRGIAFLMVFAEVSWRLVEQRSMARSRREPAWSASIER